ncbi:hypothetical protein HGM15179_015213 [Zosterops borbonicus]|uniref:Uncharacterized protein n=1 Tax=Zosterops borbonicus TaxID=364589 RepID=A0A8K1G5C3_9PASS|nr:hypothetical protein HGM15179_015213 [Zosterops borbonicus]
MCVRYSQGCLANIESPKSSRSDRKRIDVIAKRHCGESIVKSRHSEFWLPSFQFAPGNWTAKMGEVIIKASLWSSNSKPPYCGYDEPDSRNVPESVQPVGKEAQIASQYCFQLLEACKLEDSMTDLTFQ